MAHNEPFIACTDSHIGVGNADVHLSCRFTFWRSMDTSKEECTELLKKLCSGMMERIDSTYNTDVPSEVNRLSTRMPYEVAARLVRAEQNTCTDALKNQE
jgi:hypothetical protein